MPGRTAFESVQATLRAVRTESDGLRERVVVEAGFRLPPGVMSAAVERVCKESAAEGDEVTCTGAEEAWVGDRGSAVGRALSWAIRAEGMASRSNMKTGTSDFNVVGPVWGCTIAAYGPGDSALDHTPQERVAVEELERGVRVLTRGLEALAAERAGEARLAAQPTGSGA